MSRRIKIDPYKEKLVDGLKEETRPNTGVNNVNKTPDEPVKSLDEILKNQLIGLDRLTNYIVNEIKANIITKDTPNQLATCIKVTMELKAKEAELLDDLPDEALEKLAKSDK